MSPTTTSSRAEWSNRLGTALAAGGLLADEVALSLVEEATSADLPLSALLIGRGILPASTVVTTLARIAQLPAVDLATDRPAPDIHWVLPPEVARDHRAVALRSSGSQLVVVFSEPPAAEDVRALGDQIGYRVVPALGDPLVIEGLQRSDSANERVAGALGRAAGNGAAATTYASALPAEHEDGTHLIMGAIDEDVPLHVDDLLRYAVSIGASDLHLTVSMPPTVRLHGALRPLEDVERLDNTTLREMLFSILTGSQREQFEAEHELDTSHSIPGVGRFRVNVCVQRGTIAAALRPIPHDVPEFSTLGVPDSVAGFANLRRGLVLVTGPTGSGKSTTLASLIDIINRSRPLHIVTVEDPIEFLHGHKRSVITQREVGSDTMSFAEALRRALRQDPDVILVGEMRDLETISTALTAAETGHLVFATLHTQDAPSTIDRIIDVFPPNQQDQIRIQLGSSLAGIVTQQLVPNADGQGRCVATEVLVCTPAIQNLIRGAKTHQIYSLMQTGAQYGMQTMDQSLVTLVRQNLVTQAVALDRCRNEEDFRNHLVGR
jgi:twitching motility protein PilT